MDNSLLNQPQQFGEFPHPNATSERSGKKRKRYRRGRGTRVGQQKSDIKQTDLGFLGSVPSLQDLKRENRKQTRHHYVSQYHRDDKCTRT